MLVVVTNTYRLNVLVSLFIVYLYPYLNNNISYCLLMNPSFKLKRVKKGMESRFLKIGQRVKGGK
tara:strand:+ start:14567 stop:14761 length:195 start_codon:yes stop_codon:yes gene_type:complete